jgi:hypothetical protein
VIIENFHYAVIAILQRELIIIFDKHKSGKNIIKRRHFSETRKQFFIKHYNNFDIIMIINLYTIASGRACEGRHENSGNYAVRRIPSRFAGRKGQLRSGY